MPKSARKPCAKAGCGKLVDRKDRFCVEHGGNTNWHARQRRKGNVTERDYGHSSKSALKPCEKADCGALVELNVRFCQEHGGNSNWQASQARKGNTTQRGYGHSWRKLRGRILKRDHYICQNHLRQGTYVPGNEVDHIIGKANGGSDDTDNLETLCATCHRRKTAKSKGAGRKQNG